MSETGGITRLLDRAAGGDAGAAEQLWARVYDELRRIAHRELAREAGGPQGRTLSTTGLVHEAYFKLADVPGIPMRDRNHFYGVACRAMRQVLVDRARARNAQKRAGGHVHLTLDRITPAAPDHAAELIELDEALTRLSEHNRQLGQIVECHFLGGLPLPETANILGISLRTAERGWARARAYLKRMLQPAEEGEPPGSES
jgi:RNA polymerase sigma factor (TIGR02999 family)